MNYQRIPQDKYDKAKGQLKLQLNGVFEPFNCYGLGAYIPEAIEQVVLLAEQFGQRVRGDDIPIALNNYKRKYKGV